jgi:hypothetical protein
MYFSKYDLKLIAEKASDDGIETVWQDLADTNGEKVFDGAFRANVKNKLANRSTRKTATEIIYLALGAR